MTQLVKTGSSNAQSALAAANDLRSTMQGKVLLPADVAYAAARQIWNGAVDHQPALFAVCETTKDVQAAVRAACARLWRQHRKIAGCEAALGSRLHLLRDTATGIKLLTAMGLEHELLNREERQKWNPNRGIRPDRQRLSLISCRFGLNSFLNIYRSVK